MHRAITILLVFAATAAALAAEPSAIANVGWQPQLLVNGSPCILTVTMKGIPERVPAKWMGHDVSFAPGSGGTWDALAGVAYENKPGSYDLALEVVTRNGRVLYESRPVKVTRRGRRGRLQTIRFFRLLMISDLQGCKLPWMSLDENGALRELRQLSRRARRIAKRPTGSAGTYSSYQFGQLGHAPKGRDPRVLPGQDRGSHASGGHWETEPADVERSGCRPPIITECRGPCQRTRHAGDGGRAMLPVSWEKSFRFRFCSLAGSLLCEGLLMQ